MAARKKLIYICSPHYISMEIAGLSHFKLEFSVTFCQKSIYIHTCVCVYIRVGKSRLTVVCMENNTIGKKKTIKQDKKENSTIISNTKINALFCVSPLCTYFCHPCISSNRYSVSILISELGKP